jgi:hypothetical protein
MSALLHAVALYIAIVLPLAALVGACIRFGNPTEE